MKKMLYLLLSATLFACSTENETLPTDDPSALPGSPDGQKYYTVSFDLKNETAGFDISEEPLTKAEILDTNDLYVINVYSKPAGGGNYMPYAYGSFDRKEGMSVNLLEGNLYQFEVTMIKNAREVLYWENDSTYYWYNSAFEAKVLNKMIISSWSSDNYGAVTSYIRCKDGRSYNRPPIDRYYGRFTDYTPVENGKIAVDLYRVVWGARVNVTGLTEGKLSFQMLDCPEIVISSDSLYTPDNIYQLYYLYDVVDFVAQGKEQTENFGLEVKWINAAGDRTINIYNGTFTATRLKRTIFNVTLKQGVVDKGSFDFNIEEEELTDGETHEIEGTINGGDDVEINPGA